MENTDRFRYLALPVSFWLLYVRIFSDFSTLIKKQTNILNTYNKAKILWLTYLGHDDRGGHTPPLSTISQLRGIAGRGEKLAIAKAQEMEFVDRVLCLPRECSLGKERLRKLQGSLHNGALQEQKTQSSKTSNHSNRSIVLFSLWGFQFMCLQEAISKNNLLTNCNNLWKELTLWRMLEKEVVVLHLKVSWRSCPGVRSGLGLWNNMQVMPFQSMVLTAWASSAMLGDVWKGQPEEWHMIQLAGKPNFTAKHDIVAPFYLCKRKDKRDSRSWIRCGWRYQAVGALLPLVVAPPQK